MARVLLLTTSSEVVQCTVKVKINGLLFSIRVVEELFPIQYGEAKPKNHTRQIDSSSDSDDMSSFSDGLGLVVHESKDEFEIQIADLVSYEDLVVHGNGEIEASFHEVDPMVSEVELQGLHYPSLSNVPNNGRAVGYADQTKIHVDSTVGILGLTNTSQGSSNLNEFGMGRLGNEKVEVDMLVGQQLVIYGEQGHNAQRVVVGPREDEGPPGCVVLTIGNSSSFDEQRENFSVGENQNVSQNTLDVVPLRSEEGPTKGAGVSTSKQDQVLGS